MRRYRFDATVGQFLTIFDSSGFVFSKLVRLEDARDLRISCAHVQAGGVIGHHPATVPQLFVVVQGQGIVLGADGVAIPIQAGEMALWLIDEWHETRSEAGLTALMVECAALRVEDVIAEPLGHASMD